MWIFSLDTSADTSYLALADTARFSAEWRQVEGRSGESHNEELALLAVELLKNANVSPPALAAVVVGDGPGSFTGLRIGFAFAKGFASAAGVPCIAKSSLRACACEFLDEERQSVAVVSDARRGEVFFAEFGLSGPTLVEKTPACIISAGEVSTRAPGVPVVVHGIPDPAWSFKRFERSRNLARSLIQLAIVDGIPKEPLPLPLLADMKPNYLRAVSAKTIEERRKEGIMR